jgi:hypothetical protein
MPIRFAKPPPAVADALEEPRGGLRGRLRGRFELGGAPEDAPLPAQPIFTAGLDELAEAAGGDDAEKSVGAQPSWRYSRFDAAGRPEVLELPEEGRPGAVAAGDDRFGPMIREALAVADQDPRVGEHDYEARLYRVPALSLLAVWLHTATALDLFVPIGRTPAGLEPNRVYDDGEFMTQVRGAAQQAGATYEGAEAPDELGS